MPGGPSNPPAEFKPALGQPPGMGTMKRELPTGCYQRRSQRQVELVLSEEQLPNPTASASRPTTRSSMS
jgi:gluconolactonase